MIKVKMMKIILVFLIRALTSGTTAIASVAAYSYLHSKNILFRIIPQTSENYLIILLFYHTLLKGDL